jgi:ACT domain-containing protein
MGLQLRVGLPDQPGALAKVAAAIARAGVEVLGIRRTRWRASPDTERSEFTSCLASLSATQ